jgi:signal peptidase
MSSRSGRHSSSHFDVAGSLKGIGRLSLRAIANVLLAATALLMLTVAGGVFALHLGVSPVLTGSMRGTFDPGSAVITRLVPVRSIKPGDVIEFRPPGHLESYVHRVQTVVRGPNGPVITTKGDANPSPDAWTAQLTAPKVRQIALHVPQLGRVLVALHQKTTRTFALGFAGLVFSALGARAVLGSAPRRVSPVPVG